MRLQLVHAVFSICLATQKEKMGNAAHHWAAALLNVLDQARGRHRKWH